MTYQCPNAATCPSVHGCDHALDGPGYLIVGRRTGNDHAELHSGNVGDDETPVWVPQQVIDDAITRPLQARIADLEAVRARVRAVLDAIEQKALAEEKNGYAIAYCALWDAHCLLAAALNGTPAADTSSSKEPTL